MHAGLLLSLCQFYDEHVAGGFIAKQERVWPSVTAGTVGFSAIIFDHLMDVHDTRGHASALNGGAHRTIFAVIRAGKNGQNGMWLHTGIRRINPASKLAGQSPETRGLGSPGWGENSVLW